MRFIRSEVEMKRVLTVAGGVVVALVVLAASAHAAVGVDGHEAGQCVACTLCEWLHSLAY